MQPSSSVAPAQESQRAAFWREHVETWKRSGLSARQYCERHGLNRGTLGYWGSRLRAAEAAEATASHFLPVHVAAVPERPSVGDAGIALELAHGVRVLVGRGFDADTLSRLLAVVRS